jgi:type IV pilus assembly protein PilV
METGWLKRSDGFTLVEVMVALVILTVGLLGLAALQTQGLSGNTDALMRSQATLYVHDMAERMRVNRDDATDSNFYYEVSNYGDSVDGLAPSLVQDDVNTWLTAVATLPSGEGRIVLNSTSFGVEAEISVRYSDKGGVQTVTVDTGL